MEGYLQGGLPPYGVHRRQNSQVQQVHTVYDMTVSQKDNDIHQTLETQKTTHLIMRRKTSIRKVTIGIYPHRQTHLRQEE